MLQVIGGQLLKIHTSFSFNIDITLSSSLWVGAWWPGFLITCFGGGLCGGLMFYFPQRLKSIQAATNELQSGGNSKSSVKELWCQLRRQVFACIVQSNGIYSIYLYLVF